MMTAWWGNVVDNTGCCGVEMQIGDFISAQTSKRIQQKLETRRNGLKEVVEQL